MVLNRVLAVVVVGLLFAVGVTTALADPPATTTTDTSSTTTTTTEETTTTTITTTATTTPVEPASSTSTVATTTLPSASEATTAPSTSPARPPRGPQRSTGAATTRPRDAHAAVATRRHKKRRRTSKPLRVTPPLGQRSFVFPIAGAASYVDTYGDFRGDVHGKWHHGDDLFAPLGTPVVAVASGTVNRVGWRKIGGWRIWVRDSAGDQFYYAHLSGYARSVFHSRRVTAGQVIGFVGNTGDAYPGAAHLHFEIHPRQLLRLHYDGAVDPTSYLGSWTHLTRVDAARPVLARLPRRPIFRTEVRRVFRELLAARRLTAPSRTSAAAAVQPDRDRWTPGSPTAGEAAPLEIRQRHDAHAGSPAIVMPAITGLASLAVFACAALAARLPRRLRKQGA